MKTLLWEAKAAVLVSNEENNLKIDIQNTPDIFGNETMITQVFTNLIGNAVKYSAKIIDPTVLIKGENIGDQVHYRIIDNGIGIATDDQAKIFDFFTRADVVNDYEGSGVGLAIVKKIVEKHHGRIWVESELGKGSTFHVLFPK